MGDACALRAFAHLEHLDSQLLCGLGAAGRVLLDAREDLRHALALERRMAGEYLVEKHSERPPVGRDVGREVGRDPGRAPGPLPLAGRALEADPDLLSGPDFEADDSPSSERRLLGAAFFETGYPRAHIDSQCTQCLRRS